MKLAINKNIGYLDIIRFPLVTEKTTNSSSQNKVVFEVSSSASKAQIKAAVESIFNVSVKAVNTLIRKGKKKTFKGRAGIQVSRKRAMITLNEGQQLDLGSGI